MGKAICLFRDMVYVSMCVLMMLLLYLYFGEILGRNSDWNPFAILWIVVIWFLDYIFRKYITHAVLFFFLRFLPAGFIVLITSDTIETILLAVIYLAFFGMGVSFWKSEDSSAKRLFAIDMPMEAIFLFVGVYIHASINMSEKLAVFAYLGGILYILLHIIRNYLDRFIHLLYNLEDNPASLRTSFQMNSIFVSLFIIAVLLLILAMNFIFNNDSFNFVGEAIRWLAALIFSLFAMFNKETGIPQEETTTAPLEEEASTVFIDQEPITTPTFIHNTNPVMDAIFRIFEIAIYIGIVVLIIFVIYRFFKNYLHRNRQNNDVVEDFIKKDKLTKLAKKKAAKAEPTRTNAEKIRKLYRKTISDKIKKERALRIRDTLTPAEIQYEMKDFTSSSQDMNTLTELYRKARYSKEDITSREVGIVKSLKI